MSEKNETKQNKQKEKNNNSTLIAAGVAFTVIFLILGFLVITKDNRKADDQGSESQLGNVVDTVEPEDLETIDGEEADLEEDEEDEVEFTVNEEEEEVMEEVLYPDIYVHEYYFSEEDLKQNEEITVYIEMINGGEADADEFHWEWWSEAGELSCEGDVEFLDVDEKETVDCEFTYDDFGTFTTEVILDSDDEIEESDETNNSMTENVEVAEEEYVDLTVVEYSFDPVPEKQVPFTVRIGIKNEGNIESGDFYWEWWGTYANYACREQVSTIAPNSTKVVTCDYEYAGWSTYETKAVVDADDDIDESNEDNNEYVEEVVPIH